MNRQQLHEMNSSNSEEDIYLLLQDMEENHCSDEHFACDYLSTIEEENTKDISERSDGDSIATHCNELLLEGLAETIDRADCRGRLHCNQPQKQVNHTVSHCERDIFSDELDRQVQWGKTGVTCSSSNSLRSLSSRATLSTASLSRSSSSSSSLSSSRQLHSSQILQQTPQPNEVFNLAPKGEHQWIGENIEINQSDDQFESISSLDSFLGSDAHESVDQFQVDPEWIQRELMRRQLESRIQEIEQTIMKLKLAETPSTGN